MLKAELGYFKDHKLLIVVILAIALIPTIYAVTFLSSMWDPYGRTDQLPIAVVNDDHSASMSEKTLHVGDDLTKQLKDSNGFDFQFVSDHQAQQGLDSGKYYAIYKIPANFSKNATTLLTDHPKQMKLNLVTSSGKSFIAGKMSASGAASLQTRLNGQIASTYTKVLVNGLTQVAGGVKQAATGSQKLSSGAHQVNNGSQKLATNLNKLANSTLKLQSGSKTLQTGLGQYVQGVVQASSGSQQLSSGLKTVNQKLPALRTGISSLQTGSQALTSGLKKTEPAMTSLQSGANQLNTGIASLQAGSQTIATKSATFSKELQAFANQLTATSQQSGENATKLKNLQSLVGATQKAIASVLSATTTQSVNTALAAKAKALNLTAAQTQSLQAAADQEITTSQKAQMAELTPLLNQLSTALTNLSHSTATSSNSQMTGALNQLTAGASQLASANQKLAANTTRLHVGSQQLNSGLSATHSATSQLTAGANQLSSGLTSAAPQVQALTSGIGQLNSGAATLNQGLGTLSQKGGSLIAGNAQVTSGLQQVGVGTNQLATGANTLADGSHTLSSGVNTLSTKLATSAAKLPRLAFNNEQSKDFASPVDLAQTEKDQVPNNGTGMAPYMIGVSLYVCALSLNLMFDAYTPRKHPKNGFFWWLSKSTIMNGVAALAATIVLVSLHAVDGFNPVHPWATWGLTVLGAITFMSIVTWLNLILGKVGTFLAMILLVLQLGGSAGTYPIQLSNGFFEAIHPYLPLSYIVDGLRETIMIGSSAWNAIFVLLAIFIVFSLLQILHYTRLFLRMRRMDIPDEATV